MRELKLVRQSFLKSGIYSWSVCILYKDTWPRGKWALKSSSGPWCKVVFTQEKGVPFSDMPNTILASSGPDPERLKKYF